jgi:hypothetical protein
MRFVYIVKMNLTVGFLTTQQERLHENILYPIDPRLLSSGPSGGRLISGSFR